MLQFCWCFVELLNGFSLKLFDLVSGDCGDESFSYAFVGLPDDLKGVPNFTEKFDILSEILEFLKVSRLKTEKFFSFTAP